jgi:hypothetical protein
MKTPAQFVHHALLYPAEVVYGKPGYESGNNHKDDWQEAGFFAEGKRQRNGEEHIGENEQELRVE